MRTVDILDAETAPTLMEAMDAVESGAESEIIIARNGKPTVRMLPVPARRGGMIIGLAEGEFKLPDDFEEQSKALDKEIEELFYAEPWCPSE